jgi:hypothetical protein
MMLFKACPRCGGDVRDTSDMYGRYISCVQCGHSADIPEERKVAIPAAYEVVERKNAA